MFVPIHYPMASTASRKSTVTSPHPPVTQWLVLSKSMLAPEIRLAYVSYAAGVFPLSQAAPFLTNRNAELAFSLAECHGHGGLHGPAAALHQLLALLPPFRKGTMLGEDGGDLWM